MPRVKTNETLKTDVLVCIYDFSHDTNGNPTSHFIIRHCGKEVFRSKRRVQCGYCSDRSEGALWKARQLIDDGLELVTYEGSRSVGEIQATFQA